MVIASLTGFLQYVVDGFINGSAYGLLGISFGLIVAVFRPVAWTDEWHRGGSEILDWDFGLTGRDRRPKPALAAVADVYARGHRHDARGRNRDHLLADRGLCGRTLCDSPGTGARP